MGTVFYPSSPSWCPKTREVKAANQMVRKPWVPVECLFNGQGSRGLQLHQAAQKHVLEGPSLITPQPWAAGSQMLSLTANALDQKLGNEAMAIYHLSKIQTPLVLNITARHTKTTTSPWARGTWSKTEEPAPQLQGRRQQRRTCHYLCFSPSRTVESMGIDLYRKLKDLHSTLTCFLDT